MKTYFWRSIVVLMFIEAAVLTMVIGTNPFTLFVNAGMAGYLGGTLIGEIFYGDALRDQKETLLNLYREYTYMQHDEILRLEQLLEESK